MYSVQKDIADKGLKKAKQESRRDNDDQIVLKEL